MATGLYEVMWRTDENGNAISTNKQERIQVSTIYFNAVLDEIPDEHYGVQVSDSSVSYTEVYSPSMVSGNSYYVDYINGIVTFGENVAGKNLNFNYYGRGYKRISINRIAGLGLSAQAVMLGEETQQERIENLEKTVQRLQKQIDFLIDEIESKNY